MFVFLDNHSICFLPWIVPNYHPIVDGTISNEEYNRAREENYIYLYHWCLDTTFNEDYKRHRKDHSPENMTVMHRLALNILRQAEKPENKKQDSLSKRMIWFRENRQFRQTVLRLL